MWMLSYKYKRAKSGFTLIEVLIVCSVFAIMLTGIIGAINRSYVFMNTTKLQVRATNLAREGVEMMFNIRDTNWKKCSGKKDEAWLYLGADGNECSTSTDKIFASGYYVINEQSGHIYASILNMDDETYNGSSFSNASAKVNFSGEYKYLSGTDLKTGDLSELMDRDTDFYRVVRVFGIVNKLDGKNRASDPKEMRFCVKVFYTSNGGRHTSELCSMMTNFQE